MNKIKYLCCLLGFVAGTIACDDDENNIVPKPTEITYGTVEDKAGNTYKTLTIGKQTWLAENFRYKLAESNANNQVTFGEIYGVDDLEILEGSDMQKYASFARNYSGQKFLLYLREQLFEAQAAGNLNTSSRFDAVWIANQVANYTIPNLVSFGYHNDIKDELLAIWEDAINYHLQRDHEYLEQYGYLYSYEGALQAVKEGAPEGFHLPTDAEWMMLERALGMSSDELEGMEKWRGNVGDLLKTGDQGIGFNALYGGAAIYALTVAYDTRYVHRGEEAYFWSSDQVFVSDSLSNGIVRKISVYQPGIHRMTSRLITSPTTVRPSYSIRLVKTEK